MISKKWLLLLFCILSTQFSFANRVDSLLHHLNNIDFPFEKVGTLIAISDEYLYLSPKKHLKYALKAEELFYEKQLKNDSLFAEVIFSVASGFEANQQNQNSLEKLSKIENLIANQFKFSRIAINYYNLKGIIHNNIGQFDLSIENYQKGLEVTEKLNRKRAKTMFLNNIALIYNSVQELDKAEELLQKNKELCIESGDIHGIAIALSNLGDVAREKGDLDKAVSNYQQSLKIVDSLKLNFGIITNHLHLGETYAQKGHQELAFQHNSLAYNLAKEAGFKGKIAEAALSLAQIYFTQNYFNNSLELATEALQYAEKIDSKEKVYKIHKCLSQNYEAIEDYQKALFHHQQFEAQQDSFFDQERIANFAAIEYKFAVKKKEAENKFLKEEKLKQETIIAQQNIIAWSIGLGLLFFILATWILFQKNKQRKIYSQQLEEKVKHRTRHLKNVNRKLLSANKELEQFAYIASHDLKEPLRNISGFSSLIGRKIQKKDYDSIGEYLDFINKNTHQMNDLIADVLAYSKIDEPNKEQQTDSLQTIIDKTKTDIQRLISEKQGRIIYKNPALYESAKQIILPAQLSLVFKNLIENGIKYNKSQSPTVRIDFKEEGDFKVITFQDNGIGIAKEYQEKVFEMFKRLHHRGEYAGSGIGLAICKKIAENLDGSLEIMNSSEEGTLFELKIAKQRLTSIKNTNLKEAALSS